MIECNKCHWYGETGELVCSDEDAKSNKSTSQITFNLCPKCKGADFEELDDDESDEST